MKQSGREGDSTVFEAKNKKRWKITVCVFTALVALAALMIGCTAYSVLNFCRLPNMPAFSYHQGRYVDSMIAAMKNDPQKNRSSRKAASAKKKSRIRVKSRNVNSLLLPNRENGLLRSAFVVTDDDSSVDDMKKHIDDLDIIFPDYFRFDAGKIEISENVRDDIQRFLAGKQTMVVPRITNTDASGNWNGSEFLKLIGNRRNRNAMENLILETLKKYSLKAINIDVESLPDSNTPYYLDFLDELSGLLHKSGMFLSVDVPAGDDGTDYEEIGQIADLVVVMDYDQNDETSGAGPIAGNKWFSDSLESIVKKIPKNKLIAACGQYSYDWNTSSRGPASALSYDDTIALAQDVCAVIRTESASVNSMFSYQDRNRQNHQVWMLDGISLWNEMHEIQALGLRGAGLWRLGLEDPAVWRFFGSGVGSGNPDVLSSASLLGNVTFQGQGEVIKGISSPCAGKRTICSRNGIISSAIYRALPKNYTVQRFGHNNNKKICITFDDGPNPVYTPQILDILKKYGVHAAFFVVGDQVQHYPYLLRREIREGHLVGNHTWFHSDPTKISRNRLSLELNAVQCIIQAVAGRKTAMFRSPYSTDSSPSEIAELESLRTPDNMGYMTVGADVDSSDYTKPGVDKIIGNVVNGLKDDGSNIIVMHDAGGTDRKQTVAALNRLIPLLRSRGYTFVSLDELLGVPADALMPKMSLRDKAFVLSDKIVTWLMIYGWDLIVILFFLTTVISVLRIVFLGFFVLKSNKKSMEFRLPEHFEPFVTVLIPSFNEEKVIAKTISALLQSSYKNFEILVINDGSTDGTEEEVDRIALENEKVRQIVKPNEGKFSALNLGLKEARGEYVVTIDADTIVLPDTLSYLTAPFADGKTDAVCGNVQVGNVKNIITGFQNVEYITTQNYDRRAFDSLNCIGVVPGATGAWKKSKIIEAGGYSNQTLTEDADLTLTMLEHGAKIVYMPYARSVTEAPEKVGTLAKQRFRWSFGTFQTLWKHRASFFKGTLGWIALPNIFLFQLVFPVLSPIGDLVFLLSIFRGDLNAILSGYLLFLMMDMFGSVIAFTIDKAPIRNLFFVFIQRFFYRQFMYVITFQSILAAIRGRRYGWNKIKRTSSVEFPAVSGISRN